MTTGKGTVPSEEICERIKHFGYAMSQGIRIYGEEFEVLSDPFPSAEGIAIQVRSKRTAQTRLLQLPATIIQRATEPVRAA